MVWKLIYVVLTCYRVQHISIFNDCSNFSGIKYFHNVICQISNNLSTLIRRLKIIPLMTFIIFLKNYGISEWIIGINIRAFLVFVKVKYNCRFRVMFAFLIRVLCSMNFSILYQFSFLVFGTTFAFSLH